MATTAEARRRSSACFPDGLACIPSPKNSRSAAAQARHRSFGTAETTSSATDHAVSGAPPVSRESLVKKWNELDWFSNQLGELDAARTRAEEAQAIVERGGTSSDAVFAAEKRIAAELERHLPDVRRYLTMYGGSAPLTLVTGGEIQTGLDPFAYLDKPTTRRYSVEHLQEQLSVAKDNIKRQLRASPPAAPVVQPPAAPTLLPVEARVTALEQQGAQKEPWTRAHKFTLVTILIAGASLIFSGLNAMHAANTAASLSERIKALELRLAELTKRRQP